MLRCSITVLIPPYHHHLRLDTPTYQRLAEISCDRSNMDAATLPFCTERDETFTTSEIILPIKVESCLQISSFGPTNSLL